MHDDTYPVPVEDNESSFYFASWRRSIITVPLLLLLSVYPFYYGVMALFLQIDLIMGNFILWMFFGQLFVLSIGGLAFSAAFVPIGLLPRLWHSRIWGIAKILLFVIIIIISLVISAILSWASIWLLDVYATPRTTQWWAGLWGVF